MGNAAQKLSAALAQVTQEKLQYVDIQENYDALAAPLRISLSAGDIVISAEVRPPSGRIN
jgi:hypothetical protein